ncbi:fibroblast growth factor receptor-like 1 isoform X2 [Orbicella faveolata]|uniref:fibroblast growth factor receptor-like 1 isoform X2 n=1 Tax=Orbicella faveolata TaxID=48498 RepID=UPI0009E382B6|nr:fibroblast growth factor receptor-like 1 isoform X2 [Orbicella faveolata]
MILRFLSKALLVFVLVLVLNCEAQPCSVSDIRDKTGNVPKVVDVIAGKDVRLTCQVKKNGVVTTWLKNNKTISPSDHPRMRLKLNKFLKIKRVQKDDAGFYTCVAENDCGRNTYTLQLFVGTAPKFTVPPDELSRSLLVLPTGNSVRLDCSAEGHPRPTVTWYKDGTRFLKRKGGSRIYLGRWTLLLTMKDLVPTDTGKYTCNVSNAYGWINHTYYVDVHVAAMAFISFKQYDQQYNRTSTLRSN